MLVNKRKTRLKKLWVEVSPELFNRLERCATNRNITFTKYINRSLWRSLLRDESHETYQEGSDRTSSKEDELLKADSR